MGLTLGVGLGLEVAGVVGVGPMPPIPEVVWVSMCLSAK